MKFSTVLWLALGAGIAYHLSRPRPATTLSLIPVDEFGHLITDNELVGIRSPYSPDFIYRGRQ